MDEMNRENLPNSNGGSTVCECSECVARREKRARCKLRTKKILPVVAAVFLALFGLGVLGSAFSHFRAYRCNRVAAATARVEIIRNGKMGAMMNNGYGVNNSCCCSCSQGQVESNYGVYGNSREFYYIPAPQAPQAPQAPNVYPYGGMNGRNGR